MDAVEKEWQDWLTQRQEGYDEVDRLRARVEEEERRRIEEKDKGNGKLSKDGDEHVDRDPEDVKIHEAHDIPPSNGDAETDKRRSSAPPDKDKDKDTAKDGDVPMATDGDDAVEY